MDVIGATRFKERCLALLNELDAGGLVITKHGKPVAILYPYERRSRRLIGCLREKIKIRGDLLTTGEHWDAHAES